MTIQSIRDFVLKCKISTTFDQIGVMSYLDLLAMDLTIYPGGPEDFGRRLTVAYPKCQYTLDIKTLNTPVQKPGFCDIKKSYPDQSNLFAIIKVTYN